MNNFMENGKTIGGFDEFACFHISDFEVGDAILVNVESGKVRGLVSSVMQKTGTITYYTTSGTAQCNMSDICFLSGEERGWISGS